MNRIASDAIGKIRLIISLVVLLMLGAACGSNRSDVNAVKFPINRSAQIKDDEPSPVQSKVLAEGFNSSIKYPFVAVLRDVRTYDALSAEDSKLPKFDESFFKSNLIIAAFLGERPTGGSTIAIASEAGGFTIKEQKPEKNAMVSQMITRPFKLVAIAVRPGELVRIVLDDPWESEVKLYRVGGWFKSSKGAADTVVDLQLSGTVLSLQTVGLVTFFFAVKETGQESRLARGLYGTFTGIIRNGREVRIRRMLTAGLIDQPYDGAQADGVLGQDRSELDLTFSSLTSPSSNGYRAKGNISGLLRFNEGLKDSQ